jgi:hypothetical protein
MKKLRYTLLVVLSLMGGMVSAQKSSAGESFGNTLNLGLGIGYYGYVGHAMPVVHANYEFGVVNNFTLAPFITVYSYRNYSRWSNQDYYYRQTVIPIGVKGTYYFDMLLNAGSKWDFYAAGSLGFAIRNTRWQSGYTGDTHIDHAASGLYLDAHIGTEFHASQKLGIFLDLSTGLSTIGLAFHL